MHASQPKSYKIKIKFTFRGLQNVSRDIGFSDYIAQLKSSVGMNSFWTGIIKAPFYAGVIVVIGCFIGFRVKDNTQSVGEKTTTSVVCALFGVIIINALFSLIFTELKF